MYASEFVFMNTLHYNIVVLRARYAARLKDPILEGEGHFQKSRLGDTEQLTETLKRLSKKQHFFGCLFFFF